MASTHPHRGTGRRVRGSGGADGVVAGRSRVAVMRTGSPPRPRPAGSRPHRRRRPGSPSRTTRTGCPEARATRAACRTTRSAASAGPSAESAGVGGRMTYSRVSTSEHGTAGDEVAHVVVGGRAHELGRRPDLDHRAVAHDRDPVAEPERLVEVVGDEHHRSCADFRPAGGPPRPACPGGSAGRAPRTARRRSASTGVDGERPGEADPLLHAAGELVGVGVARSRESRPGPGAAAPARAARPSACPGPRVRSRRCRSPGGAAAGRSAGRPCRRGGGVGRAGSA